MTVYLFIGLICSHVGGCNLETGTFPTAEACFAYGNANFYERRFDCVAIAVAKS